MKHAEPELQKVTEGALIMGKLFGTDGVRGIANLELTPLLAFSLGQAGAFVLTRETGKKPKIVIAKDTRTSSDMLETALAAGICSVGAEAVLLGVVPTPAVAFLTRSMQADAGVVISASHNPMEYNGIKFFNNEGYKLSDAIEEEIEDIILNNRELPQPTGADIGRVIHDYDAVPQYMDFLKSCISDSLSGLKIALDCANGAASNIAAEVFEELGAEVIVIHHQPNGENINKDCGSTHMGDLMRCVVENQAHFGLAFDGDADRCLAVDENGKLVDGDQIMAICGADLKSQGRLTGNTIVATVMSNLGLTLACTGAGISIKQANVGDRCVLEEMLLGGNILGGEQSGHIIFLEHNTTGDGILTGLKLSEICKKTGRTLSDLAGIMQILPQVLVNAKVASNKKNEYTSHSAIKSAIEKLESEFGDEGRVLIRPSGTEPLVRVMLEGTDKPKMERAARELADLIEQELS